MTRTFRTLAATVVFGAAVVLADEPQDAPALPPPCEPCPPQKVCVVEPKANTKVVYTSRCKDYCLPHCSLWDLLCGRCGECESGSCGPVRTKNVLVKKKVPACETKQCVVKDLSVPCDAPKGDGPKVDAPKADVTPKPADPAKGPLALPNGRPS